MVRLILGVFLILATAVISGSMVYIQWFVHPEYTTQQIFWAYWRETVIAMICAVVGITVLDGSK